MICNYVSPVELRGVREISANPIILGAHRSRDHNAAEVAMVTMNSLKIQITQFMRLFIGVILGGYEGYAYPLHFLVLQKWLVHIFGWVSA